MEGVSAEAASMAGHLGLGKIIMMYDDNQITIDGRTDIAFTEDVGKRFEAYGWHVQEVKDANTDLDKIKDAIAKAKAETRKPSIIKMKTTIGWQSELQDTSKVHGAPLKKEEIARLKEVWGLGAEELHIDEAVAKTYAELAEAGKKTHAEWAELFEKYKSQYPDEAAEFSRRMGGKLPDGWEAALPKYSAEDKPLATRQLSEICLNALGKAVPELIGGSADLAASNLTNLKEEVNGEKKVTQFQKSTPHGRNICYGVREHGMSAVMNGIAAYGGLIPFGGTFLNFIGYAIAGVRLSAISNFRVIYVMTHDSIGLGEDGPTHQPIESLASVRAMPNALLLRPSDGNETAGCYAVALKNMRPSVICASRQAMPACLGNNSSAELVAQGAYVIQDCDGQPQAILISSGSETNICVDAAKQLSDLKVRVVSMPCMELFEEQDATYKESVLTPGVPAMSVEASSIFGWERYAHVHVGMTTFGASGPWKDVYKHFGFTVDAVAEKTKKLVAHYGGSAPNLARPF
jgi:transketolase